MATCPRCHKEYNGFPALSRRDNETDICPQCGKEEAFIDAQMILADEKEIEFVKSLKGE